MMWRMGIGLAAAAMLLVNGYLHGLWTNRWHRAGELETAIANLDRVPLTIGDWRGRAETLSDPDIAYAGIEGYCFRSYVNQRTGKTVTLLLMCGRPGPIAVHTPDVCYGGSGYEMLGSVAKDVHKYRKNSATAEFFRARFSKTNATGGTDVRVTWSWGAAGQWQAPADPRLTFTRQSALYKLYVIQQVSPSSERFDEEVCKDFLDQLLPELDRALFATQ
jgi:hypothetical protein